MAAYRDEPEEALAMLDRHLAAPPAQLSQGYRTLGPGQFSWPPYAATEGLEALLDQMAKDEPAAGDLALTSLVNARVLDGLVAAGAFGEPTGTP